MREGEMDKRREGGASERERAESLTLNEDDVSTFPTMKIWCRLMPRDAIQLPTHFSDAPALPYACAQSKQFTPIAHACPLPAQPGLRWNLPRNHCNGLKRTSPSASRGIASAAGAAGKSCEQGEEESAGRRNQR